LYDLNKQPIGKFILDGDIFDIPIRRDILHRVVRWQLARRQQGTHKTKTRSEVRGGGRKPWNQKGSGRARQGTIRAPQWRGGGVAHGPVPRTHQHDLQKRVRRLGLKCALSAKAWERRVIVVDSLRPVDFKTKTMDGHVAALLEGAPRRSVLMVDSDKDGLDGG
jgi:large subunit ribosomal protein L4